MEMHLAPKSLCWQQETVILLDDEPESLQSVPAALQDICCLCVPCQTLQQALEAARRHPPALLICGQAQGVAAWQAIAARASLERLPVIFLSYAQLPDVIHRAEPLGGAYYVRRASAAEVLPKLAGQVLAAQHRRVPQQRAIAHVASGAFSV